MKWLVLEQNENELKEWAKFENIDLDEYEIVLLKDICFVDSCTFRIETNIDNTHISDKELYYFNVLDGYYTKVFTNEEYIYYCLDGCWF